MPGLSIARTRHERNDELFATALQPITTLDRYVFEELARSTSTTVGAAGYPEYPIRMVENDRHFVVFEGHVYDPEPPSDSELLSLTQDVFTGDSATSLSEWVGTVDGEFVILFGDTGTGALALCNDTFGALPVYYYTDEQTTLLSRDVSFVHDYAAKDGFGVSVDRLGIAQFLLFSYTLGDRTMFDNIKRLPPGSLLRTTGSSVEVRSLHEYSFGEKHHADRTIKENATRLVELFREACRNRAGLTDRDIVALSGGLDSRGVAAACAANRTSFTAITHTNGGLEEVKIAKRMARLMDVNWEAYDVSVSEKHRSRLLNMKRGLLPIQGAFGLAVYEQLLGEYGHAITKFTGFGGDKLFPDLRPPRWVDSDGALAEELVESEACFEIDDVVSMTDVTREEIVGSIHERITSYPEMPLADKRAKFLLRERSVNRFGESNDMEKQYYWTVSPYYSPSFFRYVMACPYEQKYHRKLHKRFLEELSPRIAAVPNANTGRKIGSPIPRLRRSARQFVANRPLLRTPAKAIVGRSDDPSPSAVGPLIREQVEHGAGSETCLSADSVRRVLAEETAYGEGTLQQLLTVTSLIDDFSPLNA